MNIRINVTALCLTIFLGALLGSPNAVSERNNAIEHSHQHSKHKHAKQEQNLHTMPNQAPEKSAVGVGDEHDIGVKLTAAQMRLAGVKVDTIFPKPQTNEIYAPGEVKANGYTSYLVSPRTDSVVISRHASLGDHVKAGQALVTLFSETMAQAQADFLISSTEWYRAKQLTTGTMSERALVAAENSYKATYGKLIAFGLTPQAINKIETQDNKTFGQYTLIAERDGVILHDEFMQGQRIEAGEQIIMLADENELWVEASVPANEKLDLGVNSLAIVVLNGAKYQAKVIQEAHTIDPITRTRIIRLAVNNKDHSLHSGMFVKVYFQIDANVSVMAVPEQALLREANGDWIVFIEKHTGEFQPKVIKRGRSFGNYREIEGLQPGVRVALEGAFFLSSEMAKSGFDPHNH